MFCPATQGPGTQQKPLQFSILDRVCGGQAGCASKSSRPPTKGSALIAAQKTPAPREWPLSQPCSPCPQVHPVSYRASNYSRAPQPLVFFLWRHRKCHLLLQKITAFG